MQINPFMMMAAMQNPRQFVLKTIQENPSIQGNPMVANMLNMINSGNIQGAEQTAKNIAKTYGIDLTQFGIK